jgi:hypothetical protein
MFTFTEDTTASKEREISSNCTFRATPGWKCRYLVPRPPPGTSTPVSFTATGCTSMEGTCWMNQLTNANAKPNVRPSHIAINASFASRQRHKRPSHVPPSTPSSLPASFNGMERISELFSYDLVTEHFSLIDCSSADAPSGRSSLVMQVHENSLCKWACFEIPLSFSLLPLTSIVEISGFYRRRLWRI